MKKQRQAAGNRPRRGERKPDVETGVAARRTRHKPNPALRRLEKALAERDRLEERLDSFEEALYREERELLRLCTEEHSTDAVRAYFNGRRDSLLWAAKRLRWP